MYQVTLEIGGSRKYCESLLDAIVPDNIDVPSYMNISSSCRDTVEGYMFETDISVREKARYFDSLRGTLDEILYVIEMIDNSLTILK